jgi:hypothetical protein
MPEGAPCLAQAIAESKSMATVYGYTEAYELVAMGGGLAMTGGAVVKIKKNRSINSSGIRHWICERPLSNFEPAQLILLICGRNAVRRSRSSSVELRFQKWEKSATSFEGESWGVDWRK